MIAWIGWAGQIIMTKFHVDHGYTHYLFIFYSLFHKLKYLTFFSKFDYFVGKHQKRHSSLWCIWFMNKVNPPPPTSTLCSLRCGNKATPNLYMTLPTYSETVKIIVYISPVPITIDYVINCHFLFILFSSHHTSHFHSWIYSLITPCGRLKSTPMWFPQHCIPLQLLH